jgi:hypothetical protein
MHEMLVYILAQTFVAAESAVSLCAEMWLWVRTHTRKISPTFCSARAETSLCWFANHCYCCCASPTNRETARDLNFTIITSLFWTRPGTFSANRAPHLIKCLHPRHCRTLRQLCCTLWQNQLGVDCVKLGSANRMLNIYFYSCLQ